MARRRKTVTVTRIETGIVRRDGPLGTSFVATVELPRAPDGRRQQRRRTFDTLEEARDWLLRTRHELRAGVYVDPSPQPLGAYLAEWLTLRRVAGVRPATIYSYRTALDRFRDLAGVRLRDLTPDLISQQLVRQHGHYAPTTLHVALTVLRMALADAVRRGLLAANPAEPVRSPRYQPEAPRPLTASEAQRLLAATREDWYGPLWQFALETGCRVGEACALRWTDLDWDRGRVRIARTVSRTETGHLIEREPKSAAGQRLIPLSPATLAVLRAHWQAERERRRLDPEWNPDDFVFPSPRGRQSRRQAVNRALALACQRAGLAVRSFHDLRHTHGTLLIAAGIDVKTVSERLGHASVAITLGLYVHPDEQAHQAAASAIGAALTGSGDTMVTKLRLVGENTA